MDKLSKFEKSEKLTEFVKIIISYLIENPPTLGHGFSHLIITARTAYKVALANKPSLCEKAYLGGFLHDIYRPALGEAGQEKHEEESSQIAKELLTKSYFSKFAVEISQVLNEKDELILTNQSSYLTNMLSIADKTEMNFQRGVAYTWASNQELMRNHKTIVYHNFIEVMRDFAHFQVKAWKVFNAIKINGVNEAIDSYIICNKDLLKVVKLETTGKINYLEESLKISVKEAELEHKFLKHFGIKKGPGLKLMKYYPKLTN